MKPSPLSRLYAPVPVVRDLTALYPVSHTMPQLAAVLTRKVCRIRALRVIMLPFQRFRVQLAEGTVVVALVTGDRVAWHFILAKFVGSHA
jgi:hypothetical protein